METMTLLKDKHIILGVTGSIAAYKAVDLASKLTQAGAHIDVVLTSAAQRFVTPLTFQAVTGRPVYTDLWQTDASGGLPTHIAHVALAERADLLCIAPATASTIARLAQGQADDLLAVTALAARCPLDLAPAMDGGMYAHAAVQANLQTLRSRGAILIAPEVGRFASGLVGQGRLPETPTLLGHIRRIIGRAGALAGRHIVVSAGGTREPIDPVRYISNRSSGKQGYALAQAALDAGAQVTLVTTVELPDPVGAVVVRVETAQAMAEAVLQHSREADALIMAAAVADYRPTQAADQKLKKTEADLSISLAANPDILLAVREQRAQGRGPRIVVGFAAETQDLIANARAKLVRKNLDLLVANDVSAPDAGFAHDTNRVTLVSATDEQALDLMSKVQVSEHIVARIAGLLAEGP